MKENIIKWIKEYVTNNNIKSLVIGISGGIDSAITSTLRAQTGIKTLIISMPIHQDPSQLTRAHNHIEWLCNKYNNL